MTTTTPEEPNINPDEIDTPTAPDDPDPFGSPSAPEPTDGWTMTEPALELGAVEEHNAAADSSLPPPETVQTVDEADVRDQESLEEPIDDEELPTDLPQEDPEVQP